MMSKSHYWVVCDAVDFIRAYGNEEEKRALQNFELAYGRKTDVLSIEPRETAVETLVGLEAMNTDKYSDLALEFNELKFLGKGSITGLAYHQFTAMNHFVNPYPETLDFWSDADGYSFNASSRTGFDSIIVEGMSQYLGAKVDIDNSPIFGRIREYCSQDGKNWDANFSGLISRTKFAPWTALSRFYYYSFIYKHFEPLEVNGPNSHIAGIQLLGPVVHAVADACSVQHVRGTLGYGHAVWENYLKSMVYHKRLAIDPQMVRMFLNSAPLHPACRSKNVSGPDTLDIPSLVFQLSVRTADRIKASTKQSWDTLWTAGEDFWKKYLHGSSLESDTGYLYHMAIAATVHVLKEACHDLVALSILDPGSGLRQPELKPSFEKAPGDLIKFTSRETEADGATISRASDPLDDPRMLLGFEPVGKSGLSVRLKEFNKLFASATLEKLDTSRASDALKDIQSELLTQYKLKSRQDDPAFCPMAATQDLPEDSDLSAHWGIGTFRAPTSEELKNPELFSNYVALNDIHCYKAHKLQLTQLLAGLEFRTQTPGLATEDQKKVSDLMERVERLREFDSYDQAQAFSLTPCREYRRIEHKNESAAKVIASAEQKTESLWERIRNFFNIPMAALATAAAVALLLIMIYPRGGVESIIGLSGETWEPPRPKLMAPQIVTPEKVPVERPKAAVVVVFEKFRDKPDQKFVDSVYRSLEPTTLGEPKYEFIAPARIRQAVSEGAIKSENLGELKNGLASVIKVSRLLVVKISQNGSNYDIDAELSDLVSGASVMKFARQNVAAGDVSEVLEMISRDAFEL